MAYATVDSPFGPLLAASTPRGLVRLAFPEESEDAVLERLAERLSPRSLRAPARFDPVARASSTSTSPGSRRCVRHRARLDADRASSGAGCWA